MINKKRGFPESLFLFYIPIKFIDKFILIINYFC